MNGVEGQKLAIQGEKHDRLIYLLSGQTDIVIDGHRLGMTGPDSFLGELTVMDDQPATASATLTGPARYFVISARKTAANDKSQRRVQFGSLSQFCRRHP